MSSPGAWAGRRASLEVPGGITFDFAPPPVSAAAAAGLSDAAAVAAAEALAGEQLLEDEAAAAEDAAEAGGLQQPLLQQQQLAADKDEPNVREEASRLLRLALPMLLQSLALMMLSFISTLFVGHLNDAVALSGVVLSTSLYNVSGISLTLGLASAMDTLCGQAFGARNYAVLGDVLLRARVICWTVCIPLAALWWRIEPLLLALGQAPAIASLAAANMRILVPSLFLGVVSDTTRRYLVAQRVVLPTSCCYLATTLLSPLYNWLFIYRLQLRGRGAAYALTCCTATNATLLLLYQSYRDGVTLKGRPEATWRGYSTAAFRGWRQYLSLGVPAAAMICMEWWVWELMIFAAGLLRSGAVAVGVMGLCIQITNPSYMLPSSAASATSVRVSNLLGAGLPRKAKTAAWVSAAMILVTTVCLGSTTFLARHVIVRVFTEDPTIRAATAVVVPAVATSIVGDGMVAVLSAVLRASGRQAVGALFNLCGYWGLCLPLAYLLGFHLQLGVLGFWIALTICTALQALAFAVLISRFDWRNEVRRAHALLTATHRAAMSSS